MKKVLTVAILLVVALMSATVVNAASAATLGSDLYALGAKYGLTEAEKVKVDRYVAQYNVTDEQAAVVLAKAQEVAKVFEDEGVTTYKALSTAGKNKVIALAKEGAEAVGLTLVVDGDYVYLSKDGKVVDARPMTSSNTLAYTGNSVNMTVVVSLVAAIALVAVIVAKKRLSYAK